MKGGKGLLVAIGMGKPKRGGYEEDDEEEAPASERGEKEDDSREEELEAAKGMMSMLNGKSVEDIPDEEAVDFADHLKAFLSACGVY